MRARGDRLTNLVLSGHTLLSSEALGLALIRCRNLTSFDFSSSLFSNAPSSETTRGWTSIRIDNCTGVTDSGMHALAYAAGRTLRTLSIGGAFNRLTDSTCAHIGAHCAPATLTRLEMTSANFTSSGLAALRAIASHLDHLDLSNSQGLSESALRELLPSKGAGCGPHLRVLKLRGCIGAMTDDVFSSWWPRAHRLRWLDVSECPRLSCVSAVLIASSYDRPAGRRPELRLVEMHRCEGIMRRGRDRLRCLASRVATLRIAGVDDGGDDDATAATTSAPMAELQAALERAGLEPPDGDSHHGQL